MLFLWTKTWPRTDELDERRVRKTRKMFMSREKSMQFGVGFVAPRFSTIVLVPCFAEARTHTDAHTRNRDFERENEIDVRENELLQLSNYIIQRRNFVLCANVRCRFKWEFIRASSFSFLLSNNKTVTDWMLFLVSSQRLVHRKIIWKIYLMIFGWNLTWRSARLVRWRSCFTISILFSSTSCLLLIFMPHTFDFLMRFFDAFCLFLFHLTRRQSRRWHCSFLLQNCKAEK